MEKIHILTDSSSDIPHDLVEAHGIEIVPIMLTHEGRSFREYYDITSEDYCRLLETSSEIPGTAMTTPTVFLESYNRAFERGCTHLLAVLINGNGSGTYQAARDYILSTILSNYSEDASVLLSTHLIADVERVLDEVIFLKEGAMVLHDTVDHIREEHGKSVDALFREVFAC